MITDTLRPLRVLDHLPTLLHRPTLLPVLRAELRSIEDLIEVGTYVDGDEEELAADVAEVLADVEAAWPPDALEAARAALAA